jgi:pimeloyl-ACP methyl ester carboxylesterase
MSQPAPSNGQEIIMLRSSHSYRRVRSLLLTALVAALGVSALASSIVSARSGRSAKTPTKPTVVLVHGAFADASGWAGVISRLQHGGYTVIAPANPLRSVTGDAAYLRSVLATVKGPIVLVGHSYGGFVVTNAAFGNPNIKALVYIAAYAPKEGETISDITALAPGSELGPKTLIIQTVPGPNGADVQEGYVNPAVFHELFAADVPADTASVMAASQRPAAVATLAEPSGPPAWQSIPSWYMVAGRDNVVGTAAELLMARRMGAHTVEIKTASHAVMVSHPQAVTRLILEAARSTAN